MRTRFRNDSEVLCHVHDSPKVKTAFLALISSAILKGRVLAKAQELIDTIQNEVSLASTEEIEEDV